MVKISKTYVPNLKEKYMCEKHKAYFKKKLTEWKNEIIKSSNIFTNDLKKSHEEKNNTNPDTNNILIICFFINLITSSAQDSGMEYNDLGIIFLCLI